MSQTLFSVWEVPEELDDVQLLIREDEYIGVLEPCGPVLALYTFWVFLVHTVSAF